MDEKTPVVKVKQNVKSGSMKRLVVLIVVALSVLGAAGFGVYAYKTGFFKAFQIARQIQEQRQLSLDDKKVLEQLKALIELPSDIVPTMAIVSDSEKLKGMQAEFFKNAKNGDRLIIYPDIAILFDSEANKIIKVGPVRFGQSEKPIEVSLIFVSGASTAAETVSATLKKEFSGLNVNLAGASKTDDYQKTLVVDLTGKLGEQAKSIAEKISARVDSLPEGEVAPKDAEILVIIGNNQ